MMGPSSGGPSSGGGGYTPPLALAEINVTPLVDVMLVLLIVFMITAPLMQQGMNVELPKANTGALREVPDQIILVLDRNQNVIFNKAAIVRTSLAARLTAMAQSKPGIEVFVHADAHVPYGAVAQLVADVKKSGIHRVGLVTQPETQGRHGK